MSNISVKGVLYISKSPRKQTPITTSSGDDKPKINISRVSSSNNSINTDSNAQNRTNQRLDSSSNSQRFYNQNTLTPTRITGRINNNNNNSSQVKNIISHSRSPASASSISQTSFGSFFINNVNQQQQNSSSRQTPQQQFLRIATEEQSPYRFSKTNIHFQSPISHKSPLSSHGFSQNQSFSCFGTSQMQQINQRTQETAPQQLQSGRNSNSSQKNSINYNLLNNTFNQNANKRQYFGSKFDNNTPNNNKNNSFDLNKSNTNIIQTNLKQANTGNTKEQSIYSMILADQGRGDNSRLKSGGNKQYLAYDDQDNNINSNINNNDDTINNNPRKVSDHLRIMQQQQQQQQSQQQQLYQMYQQQQQQQQEFKKSNMLKQSLGVLSLANGSSDQYLNVRENEVKEIVSNDKSRMSGVNEDKIPIKEAVSYPTGDQAPISCLNCLEQQRKVEKLLQLISQCQKCSQINWDNLSENNITNSSFNVFNRSSFNQSQILHPVSNTPTESREITQQITSLKRQLDAVRQEREVEHNKNQLIQSRLDLKESELSQIKSQCVDLKDQLKEYEMLKVSLGKIDLEITKELSQETEYLKAFINNIIDCQVSQRTQDSRQEEVEQLGDKTKMNSNQVKDQIDNKTQENIQNNEEKHQQQCNFVIPSAIKALDVVYRLKIQEQSVKSDNPFIQPANPVPPF